MTSAEAELRLPADTAYVAVLRMTTAGLAARLDFTLEEIEDLRMAVGEACSLVLVDASADGSLYASYALGDGSITVTVCADSDAGLPDLESFGWQVLNALVDDVHADADAGRSRIGFTLTSRSAGAAT